MAHKWLFSYVLIFILLLVSGPACATDGFTPQDRVLLTELNIRVAELEKHMNERFEQVDKRFEELRNDMNERFQQVDNQFANMVQLIIGILATFGGIVVVAISFALWDRRTMIRPFEDKVAKIEEKIAGNKRQIRALIKALRELAPSHPKVAEILRSFSLL